MFKDAFQQLGNSQVEAKFDADDERLAQLVLGPQGPVAAMEDHVLKKYAVPAHRVFSRSSIQSSMPQCSNGHAADEFIEKL